MTKTVLLIRNAASTDFGGGERVPVNIAAELQNQGFSPVIVSRSSRLLSFAKEREITTIRGWWWSRQDWSGKNNLLLPIYFAWQFVLFFWYVQLIIRTKATIIHPQGKDDFIAASLAGAILRRKVVWSDYADLKYIYQNNNVWYKNLVGKLIKFLDRIPRSIILTSYNDKRLIEESLGSTLPGKYEVVHYGVPRAEIPKIHRPADEHDSIIFTATSRLVTAKGIGELVEAFNALSQDHPNVRLWIFGEGPEEDQFREIASGNKLISFRGFPDNALSHVADCDVFVHPSYLEGFSISLIEAAKLGLPIIACNVGGNPELVVDKENGLLVPARDSKALYEAMKILAEDENLRQQYGKSARKVYESRLVFEDIIKKEIVRIYEK